MYYIGYIRLTVIIPLTLLITFPPCSLGFSIGFAAFVGPHFLPIFGVVDYFPTAVNATDSASLFVLRSGMLIRRGKDFQRGFALGNGDAGEISQSWERTLNQTIAIRHGEHGDPDNPGLVILPPNG